jgi:uncharacterized protein (TIGR02118 family)
MYKVLAPAQMNPGKRTLAEFHNYWAESHGPLFANTKYLRRYVQHLSLPEAYGSDPSPTFDGVSMFWYDDWRDQRAPSDDPEVQALRQAVREDDAQLFDRLPGWPLHHKRASVVAEEKVIVDGKTAPEMVKAIFIASKMPGLSLDEFFDHWQNVHGPLGARVPGLRRYVQNHGVREAYVPGTTQTHDGWAEMWFDNLASLQAARKSPEWQALGEDGATLFTYPMGIGVARERVQKDLDWQYNDWGVNALSEEQIRERLQKDGYRRLAADPDAPRKIKAAAASKTLAVWTWEHLVTIDASRIDERPEK